MDYRVDEDRVTFIPTFSPLVTDPAPPVTLRWRREPSGALEFDPVYPLDWFNSALFGVEWARVR